MGIHFASPRTEKKGKQEKPIKYKDWIMYRCKFEGQKIQSLNSPILGAGSYCCSLLANCIVTRGQETLVVSCDIGPRY
jgi:hypothetical protein